jgi:hypothetical protein
MRKLGAVVIMACCLAPLSSAEPSASGPTTTNAAVDGDIKEMREAVSAAMKKWYEPAQKDYRLQPDMDAFGFLVKYLCSSKEEVRQEAIKVVVELKYPIKSALFEPCMSDKYPLDVQMVAFGRSVRGDGMFGEDRERMKKTWVAMAKKLSAPIAPPYFKYVMLQLGQTFPARDVLSQTDQSIICRRILSVVGGLTHGEKVSVFQAAILYVDQATLATEMVQWYGVETDPEAREFMLWLCSQIKGGNDHKAIAIARKVVKLALADPCEANRKEAKMQAEALGMGSE